MQYKVVPGPKLVVGDSSNASKLFQDIINNNAVDGWKYHSMETITTQEKSGCLKGQPAAISSYMLIFEKEN